MWRLLDRQTVSCGQVVYPCVPSLADQYAHRLLAAWEAIGRRFSTAEADELKALLTRAMTEGRRASPFSLLVVNYEAEPPPSAKLGYQIQIAERSESDHFDVYKQHRGEKLFGGHPDAKLLQVAASLDPVTLGRRPRLLDVGAGEGRNSIPLARQGFDVDAVELVPGLCERLVAHAEKERLPLQVIQGDFMSAETRLPSAEYDLAVLAEVVTQTPTEGVLALLTRVVGNLRSGGFLLLNAFLAADGFRPDTAMRELSVFSLCHVLTRAELKSLTSGLPIRLISDESTYEFERAHLPAEAWPPTTWFESWSRGSNLFDLPYGAAPFELRWLLFQKS